MQLPGWQLTEEQGGEHRTNVQERIRLNQMEPMNTNEGVISDCVGKPSWWERRPGGAQEG
jgi:hypothetical protein